MITGILVRQGSILHIVGLVEKPELRDGHAPLGVELDVLHQEVRVWLSPVPGRARVTGRATQVAAIDLLAVRFLYRLAAVISQLLSRIARKEEDWVGAVVP